MPERFEQLVLPHLDAAYNLARWLVGNPADFSGAALNGLFDVIAGHVRFARVIHGLAQTRIGFRAAAPDARGNDDFTNDFREELAALNVGDPFFMFDACPTGMSARTPRLRSATAATNRWC